MESFFDDEFNSSTPCSSPDMNSGDDLSDSSIIPGTAINAENYITVKEGCQSAFTTEELTIAVNHCKKLVLESEECSDERKWLVRRLIELRHRLEQAKECEECEPAMENEDSFVKLGHHLVVKSFPPSASKKYCDRCCGTIWNVLQSCYQCSDCLYKCHIKCVDSLHRVCAHLVLSENPNYETRICPEVGLDAQSFRCFECNVRINYSYSKGYYLFSPEGGVGEARRCDYNGRYYCPSCHWNTPSLVPARVMHNWDFQPQPVSRASYQLIRLSRHRPIITLDQRLYAFVEELATVQKKREELACMKQYIATCRLALESGLLMRELEWRRHLLHSTTVLSLDDLIDIHNGTFLTKIDSIYDVLRNHIKVECTVCQGRGYICELCDDKKAIFGFDINTYTCPKCDTVSHKFCWSKNQMCPKCIRKEQKSEQYL